MHEGARFSAIIVKKKNSIETRRISFPFFFFLNFSGRKKKKEKKTAKVVYFDHQNVNSLCVDCSSRFSTQSLYKVLSWKEAVAGILEKAAD